VLLLVAMLSLLANSTPTIVTFGDSITEGYGVSKGHTYPDYLQSALNARGFLCKVVNAGVSGDTTGNALDRLPSILALNSKLVILEFGGNDGLRGTPVSSTRRNLEELIKRLQTGGSRVILVGMTLPLNYGPDFVGQFEKMYADLGVKFKVTVVNAKDAGVAGAPGLMQPDGIHPTGVGYKKLVEYLLPAVERELKAIGVSPAPR